MADGTDETGERAGRSEPPPLELVVLEPRHHRGIDAFRGSEAAARSIWHRQCPET
jgi:hypothetical protein